MPQAPQIPSLNISQFFFSKTNYTRQKILDFPIFSLRISYCWTNQRILVKTGESSSENRQKQRGARQPDIWLKLLQDKFIEIVTSPQASPYILWLIPYISPTTGHWPLTTLALLPLETSVPPLGRIFHSASTFVSLDCVSMFVCLIS